LDGSLIINQNQSHLNGYLNSGYYVNTQNSLKLTCEHISFQIFSGGKPPDPHSNGSGGKGERRRGNRQGRKGEGRGWDMKVWEGSIPQIKFYYYSTVHSLK
jgi:hypothetical protein